MSQESRAEVEIRNAIARKALTDGRKPRALPPPKTVFTGIDYSVKHIPERHSVILSFGAPMAWLELSAEESIKLANSLLKHARTARKGVRTGKGTDTGIAEKGGTVPDEEA